MAWNSYQNAMQHGGARPRGHGLDTYQNNNVGNVGNIVMRFQSLAKRRTSSHSNTL